MAFLAAPPEGFLQATEAVTRLPPNELELLVRARRGRRRCFCVPPLLKPCALADTAIRRARRYKCAGFCCSATAASRSRILQPRSRSPSVRPGPAACVCKCLPSASALDAGARPCPPRVRRRAGNAAPPRAYGTCKGLTGLVICMLALLPALWRPARRWPRNRAHEQALFV